ncbi:MAG: tetratricopeptide repeat protein [Pseudomonadota bacterium]
MRKILIGVLATLLSATSPVFAQEKKAPPEAALAKDKLSIEERRRIDARLLDNLMARLQRSTSQEQAKAIEHTILQLWLRVYSPSVEVLMKQAIRAMNDEKYAPALTLLDTVIELAPDYAEAWNKRATAYFYERDYERSLADIEQVLQLEPRHFGALTGRGLVEQARGNKKEALDAFRKALEVHPYLDGAKSGVKALQKAVEGERI